MNPGQPHQRLHRRALSPIRQPYPPIARQRRQNVLHLVRGLHRPTVDLQNLRPVTQPPTVGVARFQDVAHHDTTVRVARHRRPQRRVVNHSAAMQITEKVLRLPNRNRIPDPDVHPTPLLEGRPADDPQQVAVHIEQRTTRIPGVDRRVGLQAIAVLQQRPRRILVPADPAQNPKAHARLQIRRQQKRVPDRHAPIPRLGTAAVGKAGHGKVVAAQQLDQRQVAHGVDPDNHGVVNLPVAQPTSQVRPGRTADMKVRQREPVGRDQHAAPTPATTRDKHAHRRRHRPLDRLDPPPLSRFQNRIKRRPRFRRPRFRPHATDAPADHHRDDRRPDNPRDKTARDRTVPIRSLHRH